MFLMADVEGVKRFISKYWFWVMYFSISILFIISILLYDIYIGLPYCEPYPFC